MTMKDRGMTRAQIKMGSGKGVDVADEHVREVLGSRDFYIYVPPKARVKGYETLKSYLLKQGMQIAVSDKAPMLPAPDFKALKITASGLLIPDTVVKQAHRWAHQRNFLHSFFKPYKTS
jgi:hypothetical protein